jgi:hypothetical protein
LRINSNGLEELLDRLLTVMVVSQYLPEIAVLYRRQRIESKSYVFLFQRRLTAPSGI